MYDLRGHGQTGGSDRRSYSVDLYADDLNALIESLGLSHPTVCGHSLGGIIGYRFATKYPQRLAALITLGGPTPQTFSIRERLLRVEFKKLITPVMGNERVMRGIAWTIERLSSDTETVDPNDVEEIRASHPCETTEMSTNERAKMMRGVYDHVGSSEDWDRIDVPVLAMHGENNPLIEPHAAYLDDVLDQCRVREIPGASHNSHVDNPEFIVDEIRRFRADHVQSTTAGG